MISIVTIKHISTDNLSKKGETVAKMALDTEEDWNEAGEDWRNIARERLGPTCHWVHRKSEIFGGYYRNDDGDCVIME